MVGGTSLPDNGFYVVVTGTNSGLGLGIACRLVDEFLQTRPQSETLVLITTTRSQSKSDDTVAKLRTHLQKTCQKSETSVPGVSVLLQRRVVFKPEIVDLSSFLSIQKLAKRLRQSLPKLDALVCNAGISGVVGMSMGKQMYSMATGYVNAVTWPTDKINGVGWTTKRQIPASVSAKEEEEPPVGDVFCANVFGHYLLGHYLAPLLAQHAAHEQTRGRIIYVSSLDAYAHAFDVEDIQGIAAKQAYESSKRLMDILAITSTHASTAKWVDSYFGTQRATDETTRPRIYLTHPGIISTPIVPTGIGFMETWSVLFLFKTFSLIVARWLGSMWHPVFPYKGAVSMVWLVLANQLMLDKMEAQGGVAKWGSACNLWGEERVERTEVDEWGWGGVLDKEGHKRKGRNPYAKDLTEEDREAFLEKGRACWQELERLRVEWEQRLEDAGVGIKMD